MVVAVELRTGLDGLALLAGLLVGVGEHEVFYHFVTDQTIERIFIRDGKDQFAILIKLQTPRHRLLVNVGFLRLGVVFDAVDFAVFLVNPEVPTNSVFFQRFILAICQLDGHRFVFAFEIARVNLALGEADRRSADIGAVIQRGNEGERRLRGLAALVFKALDNVRREFVVFQPGFGLFRHEGVGDGNRGICLHDQRLPRADHVTVPVSRVQIGLLHGVVVRFAVVIRLKQLCKGIRPVIGGTQLNRLAIIHAVLRQLNRDLVRLYYALRIVLVPALFNGDADLLHRRRGLVFIPVRDCPRVCCRILFPANVPCADYSDAAILVLPRNIDRLGARERYVNAADFGFRDKVVQRFVLVVFQTHVLKHARPRGRLGAAVQRKRASVLYQYLEIRVSRLPERHLHFRLRGSICQTAPLFLDSNCGGLGLLLFLRPLADEGHVCLVHRVGVANHHVVHIPAGEGVIGVVNRRRLLIRVENIYRVAFVISAGIFIGQIFLQLIGQTGFEFILNAVRFFDLDFVRRCRLRRNLRILLTIEIRCFLHAQMVFDFTVIFVSICYNVGECSGCSCSRRKSLCDCKSITVKESAHFLLSLIIFKLISTTKALQNRNIPEFDIAGIRSFDRIFDRIADAHGSGSAGQILFDAVSDTLCGLFDGNTGLLLLPLAVVGHGLGSHGLLTGNDSCAGFIRTPTLERPAFLRGGSLNRIILTLDVDFIVRFRDTVRRCALKLIAHGVAGNGCFGRVVQLELLPAACLAVFQTGFAAVGSAVGVVVVCAVSPTVVFRVGLDGNGHDQLIAGVCGRVAFRLGRNSICAIVKTRDLELLAGHFDLHLALALANGEFLRSAPSVDAVFHAGDRILRYSDAAVLCIFGRIKVERAAQRVAQNGSRIDLHREGVDLIADCLEHCVQTVCVRRSKIVVTIFRPLAEVPLVATLTLFVSRARVVGGHRVHILVRVVISGVSSRVCALENADGEDGCAAGLQSLCRSDCAAGNFALKLGPAGRRAVREENDDRLSCFVFAGTSIQNKLCLFHTEIRLRRTVSGQIAYCRFQLAASGACFRQAFDSFSVACKCHKTDAVIDRVALAVLLRSYAVNKIPDCRFQCFNPVLVLDSICFNPFV